MERLTHAAQGVVTLTVTGAYPERFLNECARQGVLFWGAEPVDAVTLRVKVHAKDRRRAEGVAGRLLCDVRADSVAGAPFFLARLRRRYALLFGLALALAAVTFLSQFVLTVEVVGNQTVPTAVILSELRRAGVRPGAFGPALNEAEIAQKALLELKDLSWMAVNLYGTRAQVLVRERRPKPELEDTRRPADVVAGATGLIAHLETWSGEALVAEGDTVVEGDVVISGWVPIEPPPYSEVGDLGGRAVRAEGLVVARTWRTLTASMPLETWVKEPTGREKVRLSLEVLGKRVNFYGKGGISFPEYDKITQVHALTLPGDCRLPLSLTVESFREVELLSCPIDRAGAAQVLEADLRERLEKLVNGGEVVSCEVSAVEDGGVLTVRLLAECREEIGRTVEWPD